MKLQWVLFILLGSISTGLVIRFLIRNKPKTEFVFWGVIMLLMLAVLIFSLILLVGQATPLFTKNHMANECFVISSSLFLVFGFLQFRRLKNSLHGKDLNPGQKRKPNKLNSTGK